ncbi:MAG: hypothetical protein AABW80_03960 [Nanoarchaeota archaeon]
MDAPKEYFSAPEKYSFKSIEALPFCAILNTGISFRRIIFGFVILASTTIASLLCMSNFFVALIMLVPLYSNFINKMPSEAVKLNFAISMEILYISSPIYSLPNPSSST